MQVLGFILRLLLGLLLRLASQVALLPGGCEFLVKNAVEFAQLEISPDKFLMHLKLLRALLGGQADVVRRLFPVSEQPGGDPPVPQSGGGNGLSRIIKESVSSV